MNRLQLLIYPALTEGTGSGDSEKTRWHSPLLYNEDDNGDDNGDNGDDNGGVVPDYIVYNSDASATGTTP